MKRRRLQNLNSTAPTYLSSTCIISKEILDLPVDVYPFWIGPYLNYAGDHYQKPERRIDEVEDYEFERVERITQLARSKIKHQRVDSDVTDG